jgi:hypothetical protein
MLRTPASAKTDVFTIATDTNTRVGLLLVFLQLFVRYPYKVREGSDGLLYPGNRVTNERVTLFHVCVTSFKPKKLHLCFSFPRSFHGVYKLDA